MDRRNPSEMDIKKFIPALTFCLQKQIHFLNWQNRETKFLINYMQNVNNTENSKFCHFMYRTACFQK